MNTSDKIVDLEAQRQIIVQKQIDYARLKEIEDLFRGRKCGIKSITEDGVTVVTDKVHSIYGIEDYKTSIYYLHRIFELPDDKTGWEFKRDWSKNGYAEVIL